MFLSAASQPEPGITRLNATWVAERLEPRSIGMMDTINIDADEKSIYETFKANEKYIKTLMQGNTSFY